MTPRGRARAIQVPPRETVPCPLTHQPCPYSTDAHTQQPDPTAARHPSTPPASPKTAETQDILTAKHETEKSNHETIMASHEMIKANRETEISHIATKIIDAWIGEWMPKNQAKPIKKMRKKHKNDEKHPKNSTFIP